MNDICEKPRPWIRYWARQFDFVIFIFGLIPMLMLPLPFLEAISDWIFGATLTLVWMFIEALLLQTWGYTPGKWLLGVSVRLQNGQKLPYLVGLNRGISVWLCGLGMNLPILDIILPIMAFVRLKKRGVTYWDQMGQLVVQHNRITRTKGAVFIVLLTLGLTGIITLMYWEGFG